MTTLAIPPARLAAPTLGSWRRQYGVGPADARRGFLRMLVDEVDGEAIARALDQAAYSPGRPEVVHRTVDVARYLAGGGRLDVAATLLDQLAATLRRP